MNSELPIVIVGAGVSGLTLAWRLSQGGKKVVVCEAAPRPGGNIVTQTRDGFLYDLGPDSFLRTKPAGVELCQELGLEDELISPEEGASRVLVAQDGVLHPMPEGLSLGVPKRPGPIVDTPLLSSVAKARAMLEPFVRRPELLEEEESILDFTTRRLGVEMAQRLAAPLLSGVFAGDASKLSMDLAFPQLVGLEKKFGSLFSGMNQGKSLVQVLWEGLGEPSVRPPSPFVSLRGGLRVLISRLCEQLPRDSLLLGQRVRGLELSTKRNEPLTVRLGSRDISASHVVLAGPPWSAQALLGQVDSNLSNLLGQIRGFATATVFFGLKTEAVEHDLAGSGFIVPPGEAEILAGTFVSSKWAGRAPEGMSLIRAFVGGARKDISGLADATLVDIAHQELTRLLGALGPVQFSQVHCYSRGTPQPELGVRKILDETAAIIQRSPGLSMIGSGFSGVGIPDCIRQANQLAVELLED